MLGGPTHTFTGVSMFQFIMNRGTSIDINFQDEEPFRAAESVRRDEDKELSQICEKLFLKWI